MTYHSRNVSGQAEPIHPSLVEVVQKHLAHPFRKPVQAHNRTAVSFITNTWRNLGKPEIILDSGCGTGASSFNLAQHYPQHLVVGVDQSLHRLAKSGVNPAHAQQHDESAEALQQDNCCLVRGDLVDCWRLLANDELPIAKHFILYPNPWPKKKHLQRRWHGHPVFADLLRLCPTIELRSNWKTYVDEFDLALQLAASDRLCSSGTQVLAGVLTGVLKEVTPSAQSDQMETFLTPFEKKYSLSGQTLYWLLSEPK